MTCVRKTSNWNRRMTDLIVRLFCQNEQFQLFLMYVLYDIIKIGNDIAF